MDRCQKVIEVLLLLQSCIYFCIRYAPLTSNSCFAPISIRPSDHLSPELLLLEISQWQVDDSGETNGEQEAQVGSVAGVANSLANRTNEEGCPARMLIPNDQSRCKTHDMPRTAPTHLCKLLVACKVALHSDLPSANASESC